MIKQAIVGTRVGGMALSLRGKFDLLRYLIVKRESLGMLVNDQMAGLLVSSLCQPDKIFIDVGAHIGSVISEVIHRTKPHHIIAFEAMPDKVVNLRKKFPNIELHECAVANEIGKASFYVNKKQSGYSSLNNIDGGNQITVNKNIIDNLVHSSKVDVIKIDIEGAELGALRGAEALIKDSQPIIMFESAPDEVLGYTKSAMWNFFNDRDYALFIPVRLAHTAPPLTHDSFIDSHHYPRRCTNYFAVPLSRVKEIRSKAKTLLGI